MGFPENYMSKQMMSSDEFRYALGSTFQVAISLSFSLLFSFCAFAVSCASAGGRLVGFVNAWPCVLLHIARRDPGRSLAPRAGSDSVPLARPLHHRLHTHTR